MNQLKKKKDMYVLNWATSPSDSHRLGGTVAGDDRDETRVVCVLQTNKTQFEPDFNLIKSLSSISS